MGWEHFSLRWDRGSFCFQNMPGNLQGKNKGPQPSSEEAKQSFSSNAGCRQEAGCELVSKYKNNNTIFKIIPTIAEVWRRQDPQRHCWDLDWSQPTVLGGLWFCSGVCVGSSWIRDSLWQCFGMEPGSASCSELFNLCAISEIPNPLWGHCHHEPGPAMYLEFPFWWFTKRNEHKLRADNSYSATNRD